MTMRKVTNCLITAASMAGAMFALASPASAQKMPDVRKSGNAFHAAVCTTVNAPGIARCFARVVTDGQGNMLGRDAARNITPSGLSPVSLQQAYNVSPAAGSQATTIAIVDAYGYTKAESDLAVYRAQFGLPACTTANGCFAKYNQKGVKGSYPKANTGWAQETALDLDMASAMCPNCRIILVEATTPSFVNLATAVNTAAALGAHVISNSYGGGESGSSSYESAYNHPGVAVTVSSGDSGYGVQFPASSPHVIAVGGTHLVTSATSRGWTETVWNGAGSGCSTLYAKPSWQTDTLCANRTVADVSAVADPATGVAVYGPGTGGKSSWLVFGGTSVAAPIIGGVYGANGGAVTGGEPYRDRAHLYDVVSGSNGSCGGTYLCTGVVGYDGPTGLGTPNGTTPF